MYVASFPGSTSQLFSHVEKKEPGNEANMYVHIGCMASITAEATATLSTFSDCGYICM